MLSYDAIQAFLYQEARAQSEKRWADWLACYADDVDYFMPSWDDDDKLTTDPRNEVSLIYYPSKQGLEDRVFRIETDRSSASTRGWICASTGRRTASATTSSMSISVPRATCSTRAARNR
jgi:3-phenylpropionate/cinnamic acid dioxygenase small subunit